MRNTKTFYTGQNAWKNSCKPELKQKELQEIQPLTLLYTIFHEKGTPFNTLFRTLYSFWLL